MRVLLVDDEEELVSALGERLLIRGIQAEWSTSSLDAMERVDAGSFDLAVLDLKLPVIGGLELRRRLQAKCPKMKFIFLTGYGSEKEFQTVLAELGQDHYLVKPVDLDDLIENMNAVLGREGERA